MSARAAEDVRLELSPKQIEYLMADEARLGWVSGIRGGKTHAGVVRCLLAGAGQIGRTTVPWPNLGIVTSATYSNLRDVLVRKFYEIAPETIADFNKSEMHMTLTNGSEILFRSLENYEPVRGITALWAYMDEMSLCSEEAANIVSGRLSQFGMDGWLWGTTTPKGRDWVWRWWAKQRRAGYRLVRSKTTDNPYLGKGYVRNLFDQYSGDFLKQELLGEFVAFEGLIYPEFDENVHVQRGTVDLRRFKRIAAGVDWGFTNPGVILIGGIDGDDRVSVIHEEYQRNRRIEDWVATALELRDAYRVGAWYCDPAEPDYIKAFRDAGLKAEKADNRVTTGIQLVRQKLTVRENGPQLIITGAAPNLIVEFGQYQWAANREGLRDEPRKANDHAMDSLRYLLAGALADTGGGVTGTTRTDGRMRKTQDRRREAR